MKTNENQRSSLNQNIRLNKRFSQFMAYLVSLSLILPAAPLYAAGVTVDAAAAAANQATLGSAGNGVPVVNIVQPNASGMSHNKFTDYNVQQQGLILNNATQNTQTLLGGAIQANSGLNGQAAGLILNEVTSLNRSVLQGYQEVAGQSADVIIANPNGISCRGCGFINTPQATLTTGTPQLNNGALQGLQVRGGDIAIEGLGLDATEAQRFNLVTRSLTVDGELYAKDLLISTGISDYDYASRTATAVATASTAPNYLVDTSALGGIYANRIMLLGNEAGVGVRIRSDMAASIGDIQINNNGDIELNNATLYAKQNIELDSQGHASSAANNSQIYAEADVNVTAKNWQQQNSLVIADGAIAVTATADINLNNATLSAVNDLQLSATNINLNNGSRAISDNAIRVGNIASNVVVNDSLVSGETGVYMTANNLSIDANSVKSDGKGIISNKNITFNIENNLRNDGDIVSFGSLAVLGNKDNFVNNGLVYSGNVAAGSNTFINSQTLTNNGVIDSIATISSASANITNNGIISSDRQIFLGTASGDLVNGVNAEIISGTQGVISLRFESIENAGLINSGAKLDVETGMGGETFTNKGVVYAEAGMQFWGGNIINNGDLLNNGTQALDFIGGNGNQSFINTGNVFSVGDVSFSGFTQVSTQLNSKLTTQGQLTISTADFSNHGLVDASHFTLAAEKFNNSGDIFGRSANSSIINNAVLGSQQDSFTNSGTIYTVDDLMIGDLDSNHNQFISANNSGKIQAKNLSLNINGLIQNDGSLISTHDFFIKGNISNTQLSNTGTLWSEGSLEVSSMTSVSNESTGLIYAKDGMAFGIGWGEVRKGSGLGVVQEQALYYSSAQQTLGSFVNKGDIYGETSRNDSLFHFKVDGDFDNQGEMVFDWINSATPNSYAYPNVEISARNISNSGKIEAEGHLSLTAVDWRPYGYYNYSQANELVITLADLHNGVSYTLPPGGNGLRYERTEKSTLLNHAGGVIHSDGSLNILVNGQFENGTQGNAQGSRVSANGDLTIYVDKSASTHAWGGWQTGSLANYAGSEISSEGDLFFGGNADPNNRAGSAGSILDDRITTIINEGKLFARNNLSIGGQVNYATAWNLEKRSNYNVNNSGFIQADNHLYIGADRLTNTGTILSFSNDSGSAYDSSTSTWTRRESMDLELSRGLENDGLIWTQGDLSIESTYGGTFRLNNNIQGVIESLNASILFSPQPVEDIVQEFAGQAATKTVNSGKLFAAKDIRLHHGWAFSEFTNTSTGIIAAGDSVNISVGGGTLVGGGTPPEFLKNQGTIQAPGIYLGTTGTLTNSGTQSLSDGSGGLSTQTQTTFGSISGGVGTANTTFASAGAAETITAPTTSTLNTVLVTLPTSNTGLFVTSTSNNGYLIESRSQFGLAYLSSQWLLDLIVMDNEEVTKGIDKRIRLGDGFYETMLVRDQITGITQQRFIFEGVSDDAEQYQLLMQNAADQYKGLGLAVGVELSAEQVANLTQDIVWMVEVEVDGKKALAPKVYLTAQTLATISIGGKIIGGNIALRGSTTVNQGIVDGDRVIVSGRKEVINRGLIRGKNYAELNGGNIYNHGLMDSVDGEVAFTGGNLVKSGAFKTSRIKLGLSGDWSNKGEFNGMKSIRGKVGNLINSNQLLSADNISLKTNNIDNSNGVIKAKNTLILTAKHNINNQAGVLSAENMALKTEQGDIINSANPTRRVKTKNGWKDVQGTRGQITATNNLSISAGNNFVNAASDINVGNNASIRAKNDVIFSAEVLSSKSTTTSTQKGLFHDTKTTHTEHKQTVAQAVLNVGGSLSMSAANNVFLQAADIEVGQSAQIKAGNDVIVTGIVTEDRISDRSKTNVLWEEYKSSSNLNTQAVTQTTIKTGGGLSMGAGRDVILQSADIDSGGTVFIKAGRDAILTGTETTFLDNKTAEESGFLRGSEDKTHKNGTKWVGTSIDAKAAVVVQAGTDVTIAGSDISAEMGKVGLYAGRDVNVLSQITTDNTTVKHKSHGLFGSGSSGADDNGAEARVSIYQNIDKINRKKATVVNGSSITAAGGDVEIVAGRNAKLTGAVLTSGDDAGIMIFAEEVTLNAAVARETEHEKIDELNIGAYAESSTTQTGVGIDGYQLNSTRDKTTVKHTVNELNAGSKGITIVARKTDINDQGTVFNTPGMVRKFAQRSVNDTAVNDFVHENYTEEKSGGRVGVAIRYSPIRQIADAMNEDGKNAREEQNTATSRDDKNGMVAGVEVGGGYGTRTTDELDEKAQRVTYNAGGGVVIYANEGDVNLQASKFNVTDGANVSVVSDKGEVNFTTVTEQHTYSNNSSYAGGNAMAGKSLGRSAPKGNAGNAGVVAGGYREDSLSKNEHRVLVTEMEGGENIFISGKKGINGVADFDASEEVMLLSEEGGINLLAEQQVNERIVGLNAQRVEVSGSQSDKGETGSSQGVAARSANTTHTRTENKSIVSKFKAKKVVLMARDDVKLEGTGFTAHKVFLTSESGEVLRTKTFDTVRNTGIGSDIKFDVGYANKTGGKFTKVGVAARNLGNRVSVDETKSGDSFTRTQSAADELGMAGAEGMSGVYVKDINQHDEGAVVTPPTRFNDINAGVPVSSNR